MIDNFYDYMVMVWKLKPYTKDRSWMEAKYISFEHFSKCVSVSDIPDAIERIHSLLMGDEYAIGVTETAGFMYCVHVKTKTKESYNLLKLVL